MFGIQNLFNQPKTTVLGLGSITWGSIEMYRHNDKAGYAFMAAGVLLWLAKDADWKNWKPWENRNFLAAAVIAAGIALTFLNKIDKTTAAAIIASGVAILNANLNMPATPAPPAPMPPAIQPPPVNPANSIAPPKDPTVPDTTDKK